MKYQSVTLIVFWCERRDLLCSHSSGVIFTCEDNMLFSLEKISSFRAKAHLVFQWCLYNKLFSARYLYGYLISRCLIMTAQTREFPTILVTTSIEVTVVIVTSSVSYIVERGQCLCPVKK